MSSSFKAKTRRLSLYISSKTKSTNGPTVEDDPNSIFVPPSSSSSSSSPFSSGLSSGSPSVGSSSGGSGPGGKKTAKERFQKRVMLYNKAAQTLILKDILAYGKALVSHLKPSAFVASIDLNLESAKASVSLSQANNGSSSSATQSASFQGSSSSSSSAASMSSNSVSALTGEKQRRATKLGTFLSSSKPKEENTSSPSNLPLDLSSTSSSSSSSPSSSSHLLSPPSSGSPLMSSAHSHSSPSVLSSFQKTQEPSPGAPTSATGAGPQGKDNKGQALGVKSSYEVTNHEVLQFVDLLFMHREQINHAKCWRQLMHQYMRDNLVVVSKRSGKDKFFADHIILCYKRLMRMIIHEMESSTSDLVYKGKRLQSSFRIVQLKSEAIDFLDYLQFNRIDPYNCLLGMKPSRKIVEQLDYNLPDPSSSSSQHLVYGADHLNKKPKSFEDDLVLPVPYEERSGSSFLLGGQGALSSGTGKSGHVHTINCNCSHLLQDQNEQVVKMVERQTLTNFSPVVPLSKSSEPISNHFIKPVFLSTFPNPNSPSSSSPSSSSSSSSPTSSITHSATSAQMAAASAVASFHSGSPSAVSPSLSISSPSMSSSSATVQAAKKERMGSIVHGSPLSGGGPPGSPLNPSLSSSSPSSSSSQAGKKAQPTIQKIIEEQELRQHIDKHAGHNPILSVSQLVNLVLAWGDTPLEEFASIQSEIRKSAAILRGSLALSKGALVLVEIPDSNKSVAYSSSDNYQGARRTSLVESTSSSFLIKNRKAPRSLYYGRVIEIEQTNHVCKLLIRRRSQFFKIKVELEHIYPLPKDVLQQIVNTAPTDLGSFISDSADELFRTILKIAYEKTNKMLLVDADFGEDLRNRLRENSCRLSDVFTLRKTIQMLEWIIEFRPSRPSSSRGTVSSSSNPVAPQQAAPLLKFYDQLLDELRETQESFIESNDTKEIFAPAMTAQLCNLNKFDCATVIHMQIKKEIGTCQAALDQLSLYSKSVIDGSRKQKITSWWLQVIRSHVYDVIIPRGFNRQAIPENYLDEPPADLDMVKHNLAVVRRALDARNDPFRIRRVIRNVQNIIYPVIDDYVTDATICALDHLQQDISKHTTCSSEDLKQLLFTLENQAEDESQLPPRWLLNMIKDIEYLEKMRHFETKVITEEDRRRNFDIVPISGLVVSMLTRLENEAKTVVEIWSPRTYLPEQHQSSLMDAIRKTDVRSVQEILEKQSFDINEVDKLGWTPLHFTTSSGPRLELSELLLQYGFDPNKQNEDGNSPLHFLVREKGKQKDREEKSRSLIRALNAFLAKNADTNLLNKNGESPLHLACFQGNQEIVNLLLAYDADINLKTKDGEGCLHYAVRGGKIDTVKFLLERYNMNPNELSSSGASPIDIAISLNQDEIVAVLRVASSLSLPTEFSGPNLRSSWFVKVKGKNKFSMSTCDKSTRNLLSMLDSDEEDEIF